MTNQETKDLIDFILKQQAEFEKNRVEMQKEQVEWNKQRIEIEKEQAEWNKQRIEIEKQQAEQNIRINNKMDFLLEHHAEVETNIQALTNAVATLAIQAEQDRAEIRSAISSLVSSVKSIDKRVSKLENAEDN